MCCDVLFRASIIVLLLALFNGALVALAAITFFYGPVQGPQIYQLCTAALALIITVILPCCAFARRRTSNLMSEAFMYLFVAVVSISGAFYVTIRWRKEQLQADYNNVPQKKALILVIICVSWAAALTALVGFLLAAFDSCRYRISEKEQQRPQPNGLREMYLTSGAAPPPRSYIAKYDNNNYERT